MLYVKMILVVRKDPMGNGMTVEDDGNGEFPLLLDDELEYKEVPHHIEQELPNHLGMIWSEQKEHPDNTALVLHPL